MVYLPIHEWLICMVFHVGTYTSLPWIRHAHVKKTPQNAVFRRPLWHLHRRKTPDYQQHREHHKIVVTTCTLDSKGLVLLLMATRNPKANHRLDGHKTRPK